MKKYLKGMMISKSLTIPTKESSLEELKKLRETVLELTKMAGNDNSKPLSVKYLKLFENNSYNDLFRNIYVSVIYDRIKKIIERNIESFSIDFEIVCENDSIKIYADCGIKLLALELNVLDSPIKLSSVVYDLNVLKNEIDDYDRERYMPNDELDSLKKSLKQEQKKYRKMKKNPRNFIPTLEEELTWDMFEPQMVSIKPIKKQKKVIENIKNELDKKFGYYSTLDKKQLKLIELIDKLEQVNLEDFETLRKLLEENLGIETEKKDYISTLTNERNLISSESCEIGTNGYTLKYIKKTKIPKNDF